MDEKKLLMVTVSGPDRPGITATLTKVLAEHRAEIVDIEQASLQKLLGLYFLLDLSGSRNSHDSLIKDLLFESSQMHLTLQFKLFAPEEIEAVNQRNLFVLVYFGGAEAMAALSRILAEEKTNIERIGTADHRGSSSIEMIINTNGTPSLGRLKHRIMRESRRLGIDLALQKMEAYRKNKRMVFFDMDNTLIDMEVIDEMARRAGVYREVARITEKAMRGDFDFEESLRQRVALLRGLRVEALEEVREKMRLSEGVDELVTTLKWLGFKLGIVSGGFDYFADYLKERLGLDFAHANVLEIREGALTGRLEGGIVDASRKAQIVNQTSLGLGIPLDQIVVVGDGANDALMLGQAGLGIAYNAKPTLEQVAGASLGKSRLTNILHLLGVTEGDISDAMSADPKASSCPGPHPSC